jgi:methylphosphotriester-DNA--protein-cysteine methyltransferase
MAYNTDAARWRALTTRDANANGHFIYSVRSTNIYCRPTCPARLARRANVGFYKTPFEAEADGFRACKRCKPNTVLEDPQERAVAKACMLIDEAIKNVDTKALRLQDLAKNVGLTPRYFHKIFKDKTGITPKEWAKAKVAPQSHPSATPTTTASPAEGTDEIAIWDTFNFNDFSDLVDFDIDGSATLGYNLATGAAEPVSMGHGNAIDTSILYELWTSGYEPNSVGSADLFGDAEFANILRGASAPQLMWPTAEKQMPVTSTFELDIDTLLRCDTVLF